MTTCNKPATGAASSIYYVQEVTCGVTPASPAWNLLRRTTGNIQLTKDTFSSNELDGSRDRADTRTGQRQTAGDIAGEMSYGAHDDFYAAAIGNTWASGTTEAAGDVTVLASAKTFTRDTGDFTASYSVGDLVKFPSLAGNNAKAFLITSVTALVITGAAIPDDFLSDESSVTTDIEGADSVEIGDTYTSFSILEHYPDLNSGLGGYILTTGVSVTNFSFSLPSDGMNTITFQTMGIDQEVGASLPDDSTFPTLVKNEIFASPDGTIIEDDGALGFVTSVDSSTDTEASAQFNLGSGSVAFIEQGRVLSELSLSTFFSNFDQMSKFNNEDEIGISLLMQNTDTALMFSYPRGIYTSAAPEVSAAGSITASASFMPFAPVNGSSIKIQRLA